MTDQTVLNVLVVSVTLAAALVLLMPRLANSTLWRAAVTPLASIIGSGFLVLGPILGLHFGSWAIGVMAFLCLVAFGFGSAIRWNIRDLDRTPVRGQWTERLEVTGNATLAVAYIVSVAYYLNLFGSFALSLTSANDQLHARLIATAVFLIILMVGLTRGFSALERLEQISVGVKLAIIAGLIAGLGWYFGMNALTTGPVTRPTQLSGWPAVTLVFGLIVTVQGFETSRYLGAQYDAETRVRSMQIAQIVSSIIYLIYIGLLTFSFDLSGTTASETAIIGLMDVVAPILPALLVAAALGAQFSAAVADTGGSGGLLVELTGPRMPQAGGYAVVVGLGLGLTWTFNVFEIIAIASRAFAAYYALQSAIATIRTHGTRRAIYMAFAVLGAAIAIFGVPVE